MSNHCQTPSPYTTATGERIFNIPVVVNADSSRPEELYHSFVSREELPDFIDGVTLTLEDYRETPDDEFQKNPNAEVEQVIFGLVEQKERLWKGFNIRVPISCWEELACELFCRKAFLMKAQDLRAVWSRAKNNLRNKLLKSIQKGDDQSQTEDALLRWPHYIYVRFYRDIMKAYENEKRKQQSGSAYDEAIANDEEVFDDEVIFVKVVPKDPNIPTQFLKIDPMAFELELNQPPPGGPYSSQVNNQFMPMERKPMIHGGHYQAPPNEYQDPNNEFQENFQDPPMLDQNWQEGYGQPPEIYSENFNHRFEDIQDPQSRPTVESLVMANEVLNASLEATSAALSSVFHRQQENDVVVMDAIWETIQGFSDLGRQEMPTKQFWESLLDFTQKAEEGSGRPQ